jgi:hypothetical protein
MDNFLTAVKSASAADQWQFVVNWMEEAVRIQKNELKVQGRDANNRGWLKGYRIGLRKAQKNLKLALKGKRPQDTSGSNEERETLFLFIISMERQLRKSYYNSMSLFKKGAWESFEFALHMNLWKRA